MFGEWNIKVAVDAMPQKLATAFGEITEQLMGAEYTPIAYLGSQLVNGTNHAVLAEQVLITGRDTKNVVIMIFQEKDDKITLVNIERVVEGGAPMGGVQVDVKTEIPEDAKAAFDSVFEAYVGSKVEPFALLGTQVTKGTNYIFACTLSPVVQDPKDSFNIVIVNGMTKDVSFTDPLMSKTDVMTLGYAFTWLKRENTALGKPLGKWP